MKSEVQFYIENEAEIFKLIHERSNRMWLTPHEYRKYLGHNYLINCSYCPLHRIENYRRTDYRCWKTNRKTQYRNVDK